MDIRTVCVWTDLRTCTVVRCQYQTSLIVLFSIHLGWGRGGHSSCVKVRCAQAAADSVSTVWLPGIELRSSSSVAGTFAFTE